MKKRTDWREFRKTDWREFRKPTGLWLELKQAEWLLGRMIIRHPERDHPETLTARQQYNTIREKLGLEEGLEKPQ